MAENQAQAAPPRRRRLLPTILARPFASLPSRIVMSVFAATLVTSLIVTWISTRSIGSFMHREIDRKFPAVLHEISDRLGEWYSQRELDIEAFGQNRIVVDGVAELAADRADPTVRRAREQVRTYLRYELQRIPQFDAFFVLDQLGNTHLWVGPGRPLLPGLAAELAAAEGPVISHVAQLGKEQLQIVSAPVGDSAGGLTLHGLIRLPAIGRLLRSDDLGASGTVFLVGPDGRTLLAPAGVTRHARALSISGTPDPVEDYLRPTGEHVVGTQMGFPRFGWTLVVEEDFAETLAPLASVTREILAINLGIVAVVSLVAFVLARSMVRPIMALSDGALRIASGDVEVVIPGRQRNDEIGVLTRAFNEMMVRLKVNQGELEEKRLEIEDANHRLVAQNQELQRVNEVFEQLAITDDLTKLHNHRFFQDHLPREMLRADRTGEPLSMILIDIDDFKQLNDRYGHSVGDAVLRRVADVMNTEVREMDLLARYGGEEFALLASRTGLNAAGGLAEKLRIAVSGARFNVLALDGPSEIQVTVSAGVATYRGDAKAFFNEADRALYRAKEAGKDCVEVSGEGEFGTFG
jgi:diguanylate cyclase (GGDEF)-like protein